MISARVDVLFTCCPPGPPERVKAISISLRGMTIVLEITRPSLSGIEDADIPNKDKEKNDRVKSDACECAATGVQLRHCFECAANDRFDDANCDRENTEGADHEYECLHVGRNRQRLDQLVHNT